MSIAIPGLRRDDRQPKHRATDEVSRLRIDVARKNQALEAADELIGRLKASNDRLLAKAARVDEAEAYAAAVRQELGELRAFVANTNATSAPAGHRDIDPDDQPTAPIYVQPLWDALGVGPTAVTNPGQTSWGAAREQQEVTG